MVMTQECLSMRDRDAYPWTIIDYPSETITERLSHRE